MQIESSPVANVLGVGAAEGSTTGTPSCGEDAAAAFRIEAVELDEMSASLTDVDRVRVNRRATSAAIGRIGWRPAVRNRSGNRDRASPCTAHHGRNIPRSGSIVDRATEQSAAERASDSEHRGAPRRFARGEEAVCGGDGAWVALADSAGASQVSEAEGAEVDGREVGRVEGQVRLDP